MPKIDSMPIGPIADGEGQLTQEWRDWFEEVVFGTSDNSIGTILSGQNGIIAGTQPLADVLLTDRGSLVAEQDAQADNINAAASAASGGGLVATADSTTTYGANSSGTITTSTITISISGGTGPYTVTSDYISGNASFSENITGSPLASAGDVTVNYSIPWASGLYATAIEKITVTDSLAATVEISLSLSAYDIGGIGGS